MSANTSGVITRLLLETLLFGFYSVLFPTLIYLRVVRNRDRDITVPTKSPARWVLLGLILQCLSILVHWIDTIWETYHFVVTLGGGERAQQYFADISRPSSVIQIVTFVVCFVITDALVVHRLWVIFSRRRLPIIIPVLLLLAQTITGGGLISIYAAPDQRVLNVVILHAMSNGWVTGSLISSILISTYSTVMIAWKILSIHRALVKLGTQASDGVKLTFFLAVLVESAALQTATAFAILIAFQLDFIGQAIFVPIAPAIYGISTVLIHTRIALGWAHEPRNSDDRALNTVPARIEFATGETGASDDTDRTQAGDPDLVLEMGAYPRRKHQSIP